VQYRLPKMSSPQAPAAENLLRAASALSITAIAAGLAAQQFNNKKAQKGSKTAQTEDPHAGKRYFMKRGKVVEARFSDTSDTSDRSSSSSEEEETEEKELSVAERAKQFAFGRNLAQLATKRAGGEEEEYWVSSDCFSHYFCCLTAPFLLFHPPPPFSCLRLTLINRSATPAAASSPRALT
jgi:hypothetical protein